MSDRAEMPDQGTNARQLGVGGPPRLGAEPALVRVGDVAGMLPLAPTQRWPNGLYDVPLVEQEDGAEVLFFAPRGEDHQRPHDRDECYVVLRGSGRFEVGGRVLEYAPGDLLYVPKGVPHRFLPPLDELATWVFFLPR